MKNEILLGIGVLLVVIFYLVMRKIMNNASSQYNQEIERILTSDENKVKGRFS
ncbi:hypothetical protein JXB11_03465 [Candidatus Woesearchaeota archaeon]|nr:hypothetical protein [Candidatus Woesearchaeota archaeon]